MPRDQLKEKLALLPAKPGVYLMKGADGEILYVGKAKVLKNRVRSYFTGSHDGKTQALVNEVADIDYIVTDNPVEALLLECNLIKQHKPRYNVLLRDDKSYPYIKLTNERHPRLEVTRRVKKDKAKYFGPYPNAGAAQHAKKLLDRLYPLRKCRTLPKEVCLYYHLGQCLAPCVHDVPPERYAPIVEEITRFLSGDVDGIVKQLEAKMHAAAEALEFERAKEYRDLIADIEKVAEKQKIAFNDFIDRDIFAYHADRGWMCVQVFYIRQGKVIERDVAIFPHYGDPAEDFLSYVTQFYFHHPARPKEIWLPEGVDPGALAEWLGVKVHVPKRGKKKELVDLAAENARLALEERFRLMERDEARTVEALDTLGRLLGIGYPKRIEAFDNATTQGVDPVAAMVVFVDGKPAKAEYRKYRIRTAEGPDDYAAMREVIRRRYTRVLKENLPLPDLIVVDGGKGQMSAAMDVLENELGLYVPVCGLAKDERHRTSRLLFGDPPEEVPIDRHSHAFHLLTRIQDEVHRFANTFHRQVRTKTAFRSVLDDIPGVGPKRRQRLLTHFGSLERIKTASLEEFRRIGIGDKLAKAIQEHLRQA